MDRSVPEKYKAVIGLEVHVQLSTQSKIFSPDSSSFGAEANSQISAISLAHPGTLPKLNKQVVAKAIRMGLACQSEISQVNIFDRKNYFYPDLPKGYQITQDRTPVAKGGHIMIRSKDGDLKKIVLNRIHMEEDAGKLVHDDNENDTLVDFNRAGVPLIEIVTEPCIESATDASTLLSEIRKLVRYLNISDGNMEEGSLRCDANVSLMPADSSVLGRKVEIKNMNSMRNVQRAIEHEIARQASVLECGEAVISETRTYNADTGLTYAMRTKEELNDYRYFPDPDLSPFEVTDQWLDEIKSSMPALPDELRQKFELEYGLSVQDAQLLTDSKETAMYFEELCSYTSNFKSAANWMIGPVKSILNERKLDAGDFPISPETLAELITLIDKGTVSYTIALQKLIPELLSDQSKSALQVATNLNVIQESDQDSILPIVEEVVREFPIKVEEYKSGKKGIMQMFMGEVMKRSKGKADPKVASELLKEKLK